VIHNLLLSTFCPEMTLQAEPSYDSLGTTHQPIQTVSAMCQCQFQPQPTSPMANMSTPAPLNNTSRTTMMVGGSIVNALALSHTETINVQEIIPPGPSSSHSGILTLPSLLSLTVNDQVPTASQVLCESH